ncbi:pre-rRNA processing protein [Metarhizium album ARSEF 1941]|uniref:rRNA biogenesis protein RRP36 n=1 Tax=Metarhizium album (strain ARSEF 1941) TaxID=1081103 RepID=A0A0B2WMB6_METAS|nr:pre-rRNA processing protein [Metarhizium album ARSEF 1941]KHN94637.1 pre-rRNA processing protein [Metarhizium album ARSEF 1941]
MPPKRKVPSLGLERRVRARREDRWEPQPESEQDPSDDDGPATAGISRRRSSDEDDDDDDDDDEQDDSQGSEATNQSDDQDDDTPTPKVDLKSISFGALARAQASLPTPARKPNTPQPSSQPSREPGSFRSKRASTTAPPRRSSKHAPLEQSSKRPVSRMRGVVPDNRLKARDPRFDPAVSRIGKLDEAKARRAYAFLDAYRDSEMADLRAQIKQTRDDGARETLKRRLASMESKKKARAAKDEQDRLLAEHRRKEKELVAQGKAPFYLKRSEQKKQLLLSRYDKMSEGQVDRAIERKRKKVSGREKKELDGLHRRQRQR